MFGSKFTIRATVLAVVLTILAATFATPNQPASATTGDPHVAVECKGYFVLGNANCRVTIDRQATNALVFLHRTLHWSDSQIFTQLCNSYGVKIMTQLRDVLSFSMSIVNLRFPWYVSCYNTLMAVDVFKPMDLSRSLDINGAYGGCLSAYIDVSAFLSYLLSFPWFPIPTATAIAGREDEALSQNNVSTYYPVDAGYRYCYAS